MSELRWNPMLGEWMAIVAKRQDRPTQPAAEHCPFCPTIPGGFETEIPVADFEIVVLENRFPALDRIADEALTVTVDVFTGAASQPAQGVCEVVVYSPRHESSLARESVDHIEKLVHVWVDRFREHDANPRVKYVHIFENSGAEAGATLQHPHGQIYGYPIVPTLIERECKRAYAHQAATRRCLLCDILKNELTGARIVTVNESFVAYVPFAARWPYEVHIAARRHVMAIDEVSFSERRDLACILKAVTSAYNCLFGRQFPYMMVLHQRPSDGGKYASFHFHIEFYPPLRDATRVKHLASGELGAGFYVNDSLPEKKAADLRLALD